MLNEIEINDIKDIISKNGYKNTKLKSERFVISMFYIFEADRYIENNDREKIISEIRSKINPKAKIEIYSYIVSISV